MKNVYKLLPLVAAMSVGSAHAANYAIEARGEAMGGVGVVSASFLTAPFYNPALTAIYRRNDDVGMITPSFGLDYTDTGDFVDGLDNVEKLIKANDYVGAQKALNDLKGDQLNVEMGGVVAFAIPNRFVAANAFGKLYTESFATTNIKTDGTDAENALGSSVRAVSVGVAEAGLSLAKYQTFMGQHISFGITPKLQRVYTYVYEANLVNYDLTDLRDNGQGETMFNMDAGFLWFYGPFRAGISATNLISRDIQTQSITSIDGSTISYAYEMSPQYTVGAGIVADYFTLSVDYDLKEQERYIGFDDNTQMLRVGAELDLLRQLKLRAGWKKNLAYDDTDGTVTAGIGLSPLNLFQLDIGASYTNENSMGGYVNFLTSY
ncbi:type IX secretion system membrane protein PorP/SprF [Vibrio ponticus]|uniref:Type IX secretion system membrane protein PorP/SprF n=1 Tax=Vibrio ponticus TaxID=265668 RepID=A0A3N3DVB2_9VIBR|nr:conjugal transfer protein TraF [Vibrio ponticus]ROV58309.1 type IX secretion system membrane protein PorP/SprF [Vibrio ponticus]